MSTCAAALLTVLPEEGFACMHAHEQACAPLSNAVAAALLGRAVLLLGAAGGRVAEGRGALNHTRGRALARARRVGSRGDGGGLGRASQLLVAQPLLLGVGLAVPAGRGTKKTW